VVATGSRQQTVAAVATGSRQQTADGRSMKRSQEICLEPRSSEAPCSHVVQLCWKVVSVLKLVGAQAPRLKLLANTAGQCGVVGHKPQEALRVKLMFGNDGGTMGVVGVGVPVEG